MDTRRRAALRAMAACAAGALVSPASARQDFVTKPIPASGERLPVVGLGTYQSFDVGSAAPSPLAEVLRIVASAGNALVDSSPMYGRSEAVLGGLMATERLRPRLFVATKVWTHGRAEGMRQIERSFELLRVERLDLLQVHNLVDVETQTATLERLKAEGRLRYLGITHYTESAYAEVERRMRTRRYGFVQINYSLEEREAERSLLPLAAELGMAVIVNRPFAQGGMFARVRGRPLPAWAGELGIESWGQYFLKWIVAHPAVTCAIPATASPAHMRDNLGAARGPLPDAAARPSPPPPPPRRRMLEHFESL